MQSMEMLGCFGTEENEPIKCISLPPHLKVPVISCQRLNWISRQSIIVTPSKYPFPYRARCGRYLLFWKKDCLITALTWTWLMKHVRIGVFLKAKVLFLALIEYMICRTAYRISGYISVMYKELANLVLWQWHTNKKLCDHTFKVDYFLKIGQWDLSPFSIYDN